MSEFQNYKELCSCPAGYDCRGMMQIKAAISARDCENWTSCSEIANDTTEYLSEDAESFADIFERVFIRNISFLN